MVSFKSAGFSKLEEQKVHYLVELSLSAAEALLLILVSSLNLHFSVVG